MAAAGWSCPNCRRRFARKNQRHACGIGDAADVVRGRSAAIVELYAALERFVRTLGRVEIVARERYVLFRTTRIFADAVIMVDAVRLAIHLKRKVEHPLFFKVAEDRRHVTHVAKLTKVEELEALQPLLREAYGASVR